ncbi:tyrosine-type recombinase/integrase [Neoroseomonas lacus]|uniref:Integrase n=1 Tax=Neoroseomonas lacus TaxID=287609 RepID=A0A917NNK8_9PROT|nr:site-specific integrase [Neoroseomonas lacus]GGJ13951.1 integrase [Neoroseomonas lacus]
MARPKLDRPRFRLARRSGRYSIEFWWEGRAHRVSTGAEDEREARVALAAFEAGWGKVPPPEAPSIGAILDAYEADRIANTERPLHAPGTMKACIAALRRHMGDLPPDLLTKPRCRAYAQQRRQEGYEVGPRAARRTKPVAAGTIIRELVTLRAAFKWAADEKWLAVAPFVEIPQAPQSRDRWLTREEAVRLVEACGDFHVRLFVLLGLHTAARSAAILGLSWADVDLDAGRLSYGTGRGNKGRARDVPINPELMAHLQAANQLAQSDYVVEFAGHQVKSVKTGFRAACKRAGLVGVTPHTLRHTAATWAAQARVPMWEIAGLLGHSDVRMVESVYGHHSPDHLREAAGAVGRVSAPIGEVTIRVKKQKIV